MTQPVPAAGQSGSAEDRLVAIIEELTTRLQAGERVDIEPYIRAHPEHAVRLRNLVPALGVLAELGQAPLPEPAPETTSPALLGELGDYRILREVGRGGMGIVYEAEQISLGRRVALKVLPFAATLDAKQLQRFKNEARAAAGLHHTNIVPVYAVGCERGVHYYAMQFIEGQTLAAFIEQLRRGPVATAPYAPAPESAAVTADTPGPAAARSTETSGRDPAYFRTVGQLGIQAAEALEHAHQLGVIHRDIKPGNLLVDERRSLWVTDFGLAHCQSQAGLTMTGDLVGTLRYMSPEQALAKRVVVDHRTDVYSLGATLYELLTLEPAFPGRDRQELLRQIAFEEPQPPRRLNKAIPAELETIVLKALEKNPNDRYASARELADDLRRYLEDKPIRARPPTVRQRLMKWARRHQPALRTAAATVLLMAVLLAGGALWLARLQAARRADTERKVTIALARAEALLVEGDKQTEDPPRWRSTVELAVAAVDYADELAARGEATEELAQRVREARAAVAAAETDSRLLAELERIRLKRAVFKVGQYDYAQAATATLYEEHLGSYGVDLAAPQAAAAKVRGSRLREALLAALEDWRQTTPDERERQRLGEVIEAAEPADAFRARWRRAAREGDRAQLVKLSTEPLGESFLPTAVCSMARDLQNASEWAAAERLLRRAQRRKPDDFWLNYDLGQLLYDQACAFPDPVGPISLTGRQLQRILGLKQAEAPPPRWAAERARGSKRRSAASALPSRCAAKVPVCDITWAARC
jgi:serine/threonine protein kinase